jgi:hypothetical protein
MKPVICLISRSTAASLPVFQKKISTEQYINARNIYLEQSSDGIRRNTSVGICDKIFQVNIARRDACWVREGERGSVRVANLRTSFARTGRAASLLFISSAAPSHFSFRK